MTETVPSAPIDTETACNGWSAAADSRNPSLVTRFPFWFRLKEPSRVYQIVASGSVTWKNPSPSIPRSLHGSSVFTIDNPRC